LKLGHHHLPFFKFIEYININIQIINYILMFWGTVLRDNKPYEIKMNKLGVLHLSEACLGVNSDSSKIHLQLQTEDEVYNLCVLQKDKWETYKLDHYITVQGDGKKYKLIAFGNNGKCEVHVTGFVETEDDDDFVDEREVKSKKAVKHEEAPKAKAKAAVAVKEEDDDDEEDDLEEDDDMELEEESEESEPIKKTQPEAKKPESQTKGQAHKAPQIENKTLPNKQVIAKTQVKDEDDVSVEVDSGDSDDFDEKLLKDDDDDDGEEIEKLLSNHRASSDNLTDKPAKLQKLDDQSKKPIQHNQQKGKPNPQQNKGNKPQNGKGQPFNKGNQSNKGGQFKGNPQQGKGGNQNKGA
jgi:hypothetical protein